jgi:hypothetical protein
MMKKHKEPRITLITWIRTGSSIFAIRAIRVIRGLIFFGLISSCLIGCGKPAPATVKSVAVAPPTTEFKFSPPPTAQKKAEPNPSTDKPDFVMSAQEFYDDYVRRGPDAMKKYGGKVIELTGTVKRTNTNTSGQFLVYLEAGGDIFGVSCLMKQEGSVTTGQAVKIRGFWPKDARIPGLTDCVVVGGR